MRDVPLFLLLATLPACGQEDVGREKRPPESRLEPSAPPPEESRPFREGYTQRPPKEAPWLPEAPAPLLDEAERNALADKLGRVTDEGRAAAQSEIQALVSELEREDDSAILDRIRDVATKSVKEGRVSYRAAEEFYKEYIYPRDVAEADAAYLGKFVVLTGAVAPHNMLDLPDGFKLFEQVPYVHEPVLLATDFELAFIRCHLARKELQKLLDWQEVHILGMVEGKLQGDLVLHRCVVL